MKRFLRFSVGSLLLLTMVAALLVWTNQRSGTGGLVVVLVCGAVGVAIYQLAVALSSRAMTAFLSATLLGVAIGFGVNLLHDSLVSSMLGFNPTITLMGLSTGLITGYLASSSLRSRAKHGDASE